MDIPTALFSGPIAWFAEWPDTRVPRTGAIVYTVWDRSDRFIYVGMSGRGVRLDTPQRSGKGPYGPLNSHASGRRSGDQFCIYVCDRLVLTHLHNRLNEVSAGKLSLDTVTREYIRQQLGYRWVRCPDGDTALKLERAIQRGDASTLPFHSNGALQLIGRDLIAPGRMLWNRLSLLCCGDRLKYRRFWHHSWYHHK